MIQKDTCTPNVHCFTVYNSEDAGANEMSIDRGMDTDAAQTYSAITKNETMPSAATRRGLESDTLSESVRGGEMPYDIPYMWALERNDTDELNTERDPQT